MGAVNVFLTCSGTENVMTVTTDASEFFNLFFLGLCPWSKNDELKYERGAWLRLYGIPLHAWTTQFFNLCLFDVW